MALFIYIISFLEWFTTLSIEIIAIRNFTPIIWTNSISTSIILWTILLALSYWYYVWGKNTKLKTKEKLAKKIILNLAIAWAYYFFITFIIDIELTNLLITSTNNYFFSVLISSFLLFFVPVFYASQTIPLLSEILEWENAWEKIWKLLFFSTIGSFFGSVWTSTILFSVLWVSKSATLNSIILTTIAIILVLKIKKVNFWWILAIFTFLFSVISITTPKNYNENILYQTANSYHNIIIYEDENNRIFSQNSGYASGINKETKESYFKYIKEIKQKLVDWKYKNIAIIWAAWFTLPQEFSKFDYVENIDVIDVDSELKDISEKYFLQEKISEKINFINKPARYFLNEKIKTISSNKDKKYDAIVIDIYVWFSLPPQTLTLEFYEALTKVSDNIFINIITDKSLESDFSKNILATMNKAFKEVYYKNVNIPNSQNKTNFVITNKEFSSYSKYENNENSKIYTDDKNSIELDLFKNME